MLRHYMAIAAVVSLWPAFSNGGPRTAAPAAAAPPTYQPYLSTPSGVKIEQIQENGMAEFQAREDARNADMTERREEAAAQSQARQEVLEQKAAEVREYVQNSVNTAEAGLRDSVTPLPETNWPIGNMQHPPMPDASDSRDVTSATLVDLNALLANPKITVDGVNGNLPAIAPDPNASSAEWVAQKYDESQRTAMLAGASVLVGGVAAEVAAPAIIADGVTEAAAVAQEATGAAQAATGAAQGTAAGTRQIVTSAAAYAGKAYLQDPESGNNLAIDALGTLLDSSNKAPDAIANIGDLKVYTVDQIARGLPDAREGYGQCSKAWNSLIDGVSIEQNDSGTIQQKPSIVEKTAAPTGNPSALDAALQAPPTP